MGDKIKVEIKAVRFDEGDFECIGFLLNVLIDLRIYVIKTLTK